MSSSKSSKSSKFHKNSGDWFCADKSCGNLNFARRDACNRCKKPREETIKKKGSAVIGEQAAKNSRGLFSAEDWSCAKCGNINWARRSQCNICNSKKHVDEDQEQRTGFGGGFNEREKVEYKPRRSSDSSDEYDEFGRRKKYSKKSSEGTLKRKSRRERSRSSSSSSSTSSSSSDSRSISSSTSSSRGRRRDRSRSNSPKRKISRRSKSRSNSPRDRRDNNVKVKDVIEKKIQTREKSSSERESQHSVEEEEEEEEEDDDGDLSKYNLFDDDIDIDALRAKK